MALTATLTITTIPTQQAGVAFTISGTYRLNQSTWADQLIYEDNNGVPMPIASPAVNLGISSWSYTHPGNLPVGNHTVSVKDPLTGTVVVSNTFAVVGGHTITVSAVTGAVAATPFGFNGVLGGYATAPALTYALTGPTTTANTNPPVPPAPAAAVGYTLQTYGSPKLNSNIFPFNFYYGTNVSSSQFVTNGDGSITISPGGDTFGGQLSLAQSGFLPGTGPYATTGAFNGIAFGGGAYFQATMASSGPMSFWANDIETMNGVSPGVGLGPNPWLGQATGYGNWIEVDFAEFDTANVYGIALHNWYGFVGSGNVVDAALGSPVTPPGTPNYAQPNTYGFLWVPATASVALPPTNVLPNSAGSGAVVGNPGTLPTGWHIQRSAGLSTAVAGTGTDTTTGNPYVQIRIFGTTDNSSDTYQFNFQFPYQNLVGQPGSSYQGIMTLSLAGGSFTNLSHGLYGGSDNLTANADYISGNVFNIGILTASPTVYQNAFISPANTGCFNFYFALGSLTAGLAIDITIQVENPQMLLQTVNPVGQGYGKYFFNGAQVGNTVTWSQYVPGSPPPPALGAGTACSVIDILHLAPIFGVGLSNTATLYDCQVWQASAVNNISNLAAPSGQASGPAPTVTGPVTGVSSTGWHMQLTAAQAGTYTVTVSDGATISAPATIVVSPATANHVLAPTSPGNVTAGSTFTFTGTLSGYTTIPSLTYVLNNSPTVSMTGETLTGWSMNIVAPTVLGVSTIAVSDGSQTVSTTFTVVAAAKVITPLAPSGVIAGQSFTFTGVLSGYTTIPALSYTISPGGASTPMTGVSVSGWAMTVIIATAGNYTIVVSDGTNTSQAVAFTVASNNTVLRNWYENPGQNGSFWVQPFQNSANWITSGALITALRSGTPTINLKGNFGVPWVIGKAGDPQVTVTDGVHTEIVRMPLGTQVETPSSPADQSIGGADATRPYFVWSISGSAMFNAAGQAISAVQASGTVIRGSYGFAVNDGAGLIMVDAVTGEPGSNNAIGGIQDYELALIQANPNYVIQHMLAFQLDVSFQASSAGPIWPLKLLDTSSGGVSNPYQGPIPQGITIGIPANIARPTGKTRGFYALWDQMQQFGMFNYNFGQVGGANFVVYSASGAYASLVSDIVASWPQVMQQACILNYASGVPGAQYSLATTKGAIPGSTNVFPGPPPLDLSPTGGKNVAPSTFGAWYSSGYNVTPTNSATGATFIVSPTTPANVVAGTPFSFTGVLSGYTAAPTLTYSVNGAAAVALAGVTTSGWSVIITVATPGATTIVVTDSVNFITGSTSFQVTSNVVTGTPVTWNPSDLAGGVTLSNGNYTATATGSATPYAAPQGVRATISLSPTQILAWEVVFSAVTQNSSAGVSSTNHVVNNTGGLGSDPDSIGAYPSTGAGSQPAQTVYYNNNQLTAGNGVATSAGGAVSFVANGTNLYFSDAAMRSTSGVQWNNSATADPVQNIGGLSFSGITGVYFPTFETGEGGAVATLNDGTSAFSAFLSSYMAANPSVVSISGQKSTTPSKAITPVVPSGVVVGAPFTFVGNLVGYTSIPTLTYALNGAAPVALTGVTTSGWSSTLTTSVTTNTIVVSDGTINNQISFTASTAGNSGNKVVAPLTGTVTAGTWLLGLKQSLAGSPSGLGYMQYNVLLPAQYNPNLIYPVLFVGHPIGSGMNGSSYPRDGSSFTTNASYGGSYSLNTMYNSVPFRTAHPCILVACQCDQTGNSGGANANGVPGYNDSQNSTWNENAENLIFSTIMSSYPGDRSQAYHIGYSLGGIDTLAQMVDNNVYNGPGVRQWVAGATFSDQLFRPSTPNSSVFARMASVPLATFSFTGDNVPSSYDQPAWTSYTGNTNYPTKSTYDNSGMVACRAGSSQYYYVNNGSSNSATTFMPMNALGGDGDKMYSWLFSQVSGGVSTPTITGVSFAPASSILPNSATGTVAGTLTAASANGALSGIAFSLSSTASFKISGSSIVFASGGVASGIYPLTVTVTATNASNSPQSYSISLTVSGGAGTGIFHVSNGQILNPSGQAVAPVGLNINNDQLNSGNANVTSIKAKFPGTTILRVPFHAYNSASSMQSVFTQLTAAGIILVVEDHTSIGKQPYTGSQLTAQLNFYKDFASTYKNNPYIWYGSLNEAYPLNSGNGDDVTTSHIQIYNAVRNAGATAPILLTEQGGGNPNELPGGTGPQLTASRYATLTNIIWDLHFYNWTTGYSGSQSTILSSFNSFVSRCQTIRSADGLVPVIIGEYGVSTTGNLPDDTGGTLLVNIVLTSGLGSMAWAWNAGGSSDNLTNGSAGVGGGSLTTYGLQVAAGIAAASPPASTAPAVAAAVGYNTQTFGSGIVVGSTPNAQSYPTPIARTSGKGSLYPFTFYGTSWLGIGFTRNSDGSVTLDGSGEGENGFGLTTAALNGTSSANRLSFNGIAFGGGFFAQCVMKGNGPMAFWANDIETMNGVSIFPSAGLYPWPGHPGYFNWFEGDFAEFDLNSGPGGVGVAYGVGTHNWWNNGGGNNATSTNYTKVVPNPFPNYNTYNTYACLWVPATATTQGYLNTYFSPGVGGTLTLCTHLTWDKFNSSSSPPPFDATTNYNQNVPWPQVQNGGGPGTTAFSIVDQLHLALIISGYPGYTTSFQSLQVWQASTANNIYGPGT